MKLRAAVLAAALILGQSPRPAGAAATDTIAVFPTSVSRPVLAVAPATGIPHAAYVSAGTLYHAWKTSGTWNIEVISDSVQVHSTFGGLELAVGPDGRPAATFVRNGTLYAAMRGESGWSRDALDALAGPTYPVAIAISPTTNEPAVAWAKQGTPSVVNYALHQGIGWSIQQVDTTSAATLLVALAMDGSGRPRLAWSRPRADATTGRALACAIGAGPNGPFVGEIVDTGLGQYLAIAADPVNGDPRLVYDAYVGSDRTIRYAYHDAGWQSMIAWTSYDFPPTATGLTLDAVGNPWITLTRYTPIAPGIPQSPQDCGSIQSGSIDVSTRSSATGLDPFQHVTWFSGPIAGDAISGARAVGSSTPGVGDVVWRSPSVSNCSQYVVSFRRTSTPVGIDGGGLPAVRVGLAPIAPNPARSGDPLHIAFGLDRAAAVSFELHDLAGRRVASRAAERLDPG